MTTSTHIARLQKKATIEIGLHALVTHAKRGQTLTADDIAEVCGCTRNNIYMIEQKALAKLRHKPDASRLLEYIEQEYTREPGVANMVEYA